jgi:hypothetical protein
MMESSVTSALGGSGVARRVSDPEWFLTRRAKGGGDFLKNTICILQSDSTQSTTSHNLEVNSSRFRIL